MDIPVNAEVKCVDGPCGRSTYIVLNPKTEEITHLVVREKSFPYLERLVPMALVAETTPHHIRLRCTKEKLAKQQPFLETDYVEVNIPQYIAGPYVMPIEEAHFETLQVEERVVPPGEIAMVRGAHVKATDGRVGQVDEFLVDPTNERITHLVLREGHLWGQKDVTVPVSEIDHIDEDTVYLKLDKRGVEALPAIPIPSRIR
jgi:sporulation protein YlmC with PRC-barrel domain